MSKTPWQVRQQYNDRAYDEIKVRVHKGKKEQIQAFAKELGLPTNAFIETAIEEFIKKNFPNANYEFDRIEK